MWAARPAPPLPHGAGRPSGNVPGGAGIPGEAGPAWAAMGTAGRTLVPSWSTVGVWLPHGAPWGFARLVERSGGLGPSWGTCRGLVP